MGRRKVSREAHQEQLGLAQTALANLREAIGKANEELEGACKAAREDLADFRSASHEELTAFKANFASEIALADPVTYWRDLAQGYAKSAGTFLKYAMGSAALGGAVLIGFMVQFFSKDVNYAAIGGALVLSTLVIWLVRFCRKHNISKTHLATDAREREVMAQTYLALLKANALNEAERMYFYQSLFRPCTTGLVKEDGPLTPMDALYALTDSAAKRGAP